MAAESGGMNELWGLVASAVAGAVTAVGSLLGIQKVRSPGPTLNGEGTVRREEFEALRAELGTTKEAMASTTALMHAHTEAMKSVNESLKRLHERIDGLAGSLARLEGVELGRNSVQKKER